MNKRVFMLLTRRREFDATKEKWDFHFYLFTYRLYLTPDDPLQFR